MAMEPPGLAPAAVEDFGAFVEDGRRAIAGAQTGPLAGLDFVVKDLFDVAGAVTGAGNPDWARTHGAATRSAPVVEALLAAGASVVGRTHTDELSRGITGRNAHYGAPVNPAAPEALTGGSSSGSAAAVAGGLARFGLGTDTGGSVRIPASFCGLWGLRPTHDRVSLEGVVGQAPSFDTVGWLARDGATLARVTNLLLGAPGRTCEPRFLMAEELWSRADARAAGALWRSLDAALGARPVHAVELACRELDHWCTEQIVLQQHEAWVTFAPWLEAAQPRLAWGVAANFLAGARHTPEALEAAARTRARVRARLADALGDDGILCFPTAPFAAPDRDVDGPAAAALWPAIAPFTCIAGLAGAPQLTIPVTEVAGRPLGLSLLGAPGSDAALLAAALELFAEASAERRSCP